MSLLSNHQIIPSSEVLVVLVLVLVLEVLACIVIDTISSVQFSSVAHSCLTLCDPMNRSTPDLPVHHKLLEFTQTHVHRVGDAIPSPPPPIPPSIRVFSSESTLPMRWPKYWSFSFSISASNEHPGHPLGWIGWISFQSKGLSRVFSNTTVQKH